VRIFWQGPTWPRLNHRFDYAKSNQFRASKSETTSNQTGSERVRNRPDTRARTRWLAVSRVRFHAVLGGPSHETQESARWRCDAQLDYALRWLSWQMPRTAPVETTVLLANHTVSREWGTTICRRCISSLYVWVQK
jgi:hypothetical protein